MLVWSIMKSDMPIIQTAKFLKGIIGTDSVLERPERQIAFIGRSNVGKSSLQNYLLGRNKLVKASARPGKTTEINIFEVAVNDSEGHLLFVDLPGYGFARMGEKQREKLRKLILWYLVDTDPVSRVVFVVVDATVGVTEFDSAVIAMLKERGERFAIVFNKIDKLNQSQKHELRKANETYGEVRSFYTSTLKKRGGPELWEYLLTEKHSVSH